MIVECENCYATFTNATVKDRKIYFVDNFLSVLNYYDLNSLEMGEICRFDEDDYNLFCKLLLYKDEIIAIPKAAECIYRISILTGEKKAVIVNNPIVNIDSQGGYKFHQAFIRDSDVWMIGATQPIICKLNLNTNKINYFFEWKEELNKRILNIEDEYWFIDAVFVNDEISIPCCKCNIILSFNVRTYEYRINEIGSEEGISSICFTNNLFYLTSRYGASFYILDGDMQKKIDDKDGILKAPSDRTGYSILDFHNDIYLIPWMGKSICYYNGKIQELDYKGLWNSNNNLMTAFVHEGAIYVQSLSDGYIYEIRDKAVIKKFRIRLPEKYKCQGYWTLHRKNKDNRFFLREEYVEELQDFIRRI